MGGPEVFGADLSIELFCFSFWEGREGEGTGTGTCPVFDFRRIEGGTRRSIRSLMVVIVW